MSGIGRKLGAATLNNYTEPKNGHGELGVR
ncbi:MAG TPA: hypothetical protein VK137_20520 [Planctomycetaceae bacterium]|nr:hypothetical protein [Planctomycetaceae bacterium]